MTQVEVLVEDDRWKSINFEDLVTKAFYETLKGLGYSKTDYFISVLGCNDKKMRKLNPDYLLVLIWSFKSEVIKQELSYIKRGGKLIFHLPFLHIVDKENYIEHLNENFDAFSYK